MGQYYIAINLDKKEYVTSWDSAKNVSFNGAKLMEHSYIGNSMLNIVTRLLKTDWKNNRIVWCGDYSEFSFVNNELVKNKNNETTLYDFARETFVLRPFSKSLKEDNPLIGKKVTNKDIEMNYFINVDKGEYFSLKDCPINNYWYSFNDLKIIKQIIHPLPLLTCANKGVSYHSKYGHEYVSSWFGNKIKVSNSEKDILNLKLIKPNFSERNLDEEIKGVSYLDVLGYLDNSSILKKELEGINNSIFIEKMLKLDIFNNMKAEIFLDKKSFIDSIKKDIEEYIKNNKKIASLILECLDEKSFIKSTKEYIKNNKKIEDLIFEYERIADEKEAKFIYVKNGKYLTYRLFKSTSLKELFEVIEVNRHLLRDYTW